MDEIKPCPFCGGNAFASCEEYPTGEKAWHIYHMNDGNCFIDDCIVGDYETKEEAVEAWNRRE